MAIAALYILHAPRSQQTLGDFLKGQPEVCDIKGVGGDKLAVTLEIPAAALTAYLQKLADLEGVINLDLAYVNYEDDLDGQGFMEAPPEAVKNG